MSTRRLLTSVIALAVCGWAAYVVSVGVAAQQRGELAGMARLSGTVTAPQAFKAAQVYIRNVDKNILYMVFTTGGQFRAVALFPGNYEVVVRAKGLESAAQTIALRAGENTKLSLAMQAGQGVQPAPQANVTFARYSE